MGVTVSVFLICGAFLLTGISFIGPEPALETAETSEPAPQSDPAPFRAGVPFEREGQTFFAEPARIAAIRAEGHYTRFFTWVRKSCFAPGRSPKQKHGLNPRGF